MKDQTFVLEYTQQKARAMVRLACFGGLQFLSFSWVQTTAHVLAYVDLSIMYKVGHCTLGVATRYAITCIVRDLTVLQYKNSSDVSFYSA